MNTVDKLKKIQIIKDNTFKIRDALLYNPKCQYDDELHGSLFKINEIMADLDSLSKIYIDESNDAIEIVSLEDVIIENEETIEIKTNITGINNVDVMFEGIIASEGYLKFSVENEEGIKIMATNNVPISVKENFDLCGYHYNECNSTLYFGPGIYKIDEGQVIGIGYKHINDVNKKKQLVLDHIEYNK